MFKVSVNVFCGQCAHCAQCGLVLQCGVQQCGLVLQCERLQCGQVWTSTSMWTSTTTAAERWPQLLRRLTVPSERRPPLNTSIIQWTGQCL